jgi:hypothetical protein
MKTMSTSNADLELVPEAAWEIWYQDTFDRECPRSIDLSGGGLVNGLVELWARHLFETVRPDGKLGFSRFNLWWKQKDRSLEVAGDWAGQSRLREWVFAGKHHTDQGYVESGDKELLRAVARAHCRLALVGRTSEAILSIAGRSVRREDFEVQLLLLERDA